MRRPVLVTLFILFSLVACSAKQIPGTEVEDNPKNRVVVDIVEKYRKAVEKKDLDSLLEIVSRTYFSNSGTTSNSEDDYGYEQLLRDVIPTFRDEIKSVQYTIYVRKVGYPREDKAYAEFEYSYKFFYVDQGKDRWVAKNDFSRLEFSLEDDVWRITSGL